MLAGVTYAHCIEYKDLKITGSLAPKFYQKQISDCKVCSLTNWCSGFHGHQKHRTPTTTASLITRAFCRCHPPNGQDQQLPEHVAPTLWKSLPSEVSKVPTFLAFCKLRRTEVFKKDFTKVKSFISMELIQEECPNKGIVCGLHSSAHYLLLYIFSY